MAETKDASSANDAPQPSSVIKRPVSLAIQQQQNIVLSNLLTTATSQVTCLKMELEEKDKEMNEDKKKLAQQMEIIQEQQKTIAAQQKELEDMKQQIAAMLAKNKEVTTKCADEEREIQRLRDPVQGVELDVTSIAEEEDIQRDVAQATTSDAEQSSSSSHAALPATTDDGYRERFHDAHGRLLTKRDNDEIILREVHRIARSE